MQLDVVVVVVVHNAPFSIACPQVKVVDAQDFRMYLSQFVLSNCACSIPLSGRRRRRCRRHMNGLSTSRRIHWPTVAAAGQHLIVGQLELSQRGPVSRLLSSAVSPAC